MFPCKSQFSFDSISAHLADSAAKEEAEAAWRTGWHVVAAAALNALRSLLPSGVTGPAVGAVLGRLWAIQSAHPHPGRVGPQFSPRTGHPRLPTLYTVLGWLSA